MPPVSSRCVTLPIAAAALDYHLRAAVADDGVIDRDQRLGYGRACEDSAAGAEKSLLWLGLTVFFAVHGGGRLSLDRLIGRQF